MNAEEMKMLTDLARMPCKGIFEEIQSRALKGFYNYAAYDSLEEVDIARLKDKGFKVTIGQDKKAPWFIVEW